jgi:hypothetical protein
MEVHHCFPKSNSHNLARMIDILSICLFLFFFFFFWLWVGGEKEREKESFFFFFWLWGGGEKERERKKDSHQSSSMDGMAMLPLPLSLAQSGNE